jgi:hypothetical protein
VEHQKNLVRKFIVVLTLIKLMKEDPDRYMALQPEIMAAYADRRVK